ncbi:hypothetical protein ACQ4PT_035018 [Festuca glaucescens]
MAPLGRSRPEEEHARARGSSGRSRQGPADRGTGQPRARDGAHGAELAGAWDGDLGPVAAHAWGGAGRASGRHVGVEQPVASGGHVGAEQPAADGGEKWWWLDEEENNRLQASLPSMFILLHTFVASTTPPKLAKLAEMWNPKPFFIVISICFFALSKCTSAASGGKPLVTAITKDANTLLYTAPLKDGRPLVVDLSGPAITLACSSKTGTVTTLSASATDGANPLFPVSFSATASCASKPPAGAVGVAGLAPSSQSSFPAQVARTQKVAKKVALCLPSDGKTTSGNSVGVAIFGGGPLFFVPSDRGDFTTMLAGTAPLRGFNGSPGYFFSATGIAVDQKKVPLSVSGRLVVGLSSTIPYTALRADVYAPFVKAFDQAAAGPNFSPFVSRVAAVAPFERCYNSTKLSVGLSRLGYPVPQIDLLLEGGQTFSVLGANSMVQVKANTACLGFVRMKAARGQAPAAVIGGFQLENHLLVLDEEKKQFGFTTFLGAIGLSCSSFNFTRAA